MQSRVLRKTDVSGGLAYAEGGLLPKHLMLLRLVLCCSWHSLSISREELTVVLGNGVLRSLGIKRLIHHVLRHVGSRPYPFPQVKVLFHAFIAYSFIFIIRIIKGVRLVPINLRIFTRVRQRLLDVVVVFGARGHLLGPNSRKIKLASVTNALLVHLVLVAGLVN